MPEPRDGQSWREVLIGDDGGHEWNTATYLPLEASKIAGALDRHTMHVAAKSYAKVTDIICHHCRAPVHLGWGRTCPGEKAPWLTGGPDHRQAPVDRPTFARAPLAPGALPALPHETTIRNTLRVPAAAAATTTDGRPSLPALTRNGLTPDRGRQRVAARLLADTEGLALDELHPRQAEALSRAACDAALPPGLRLRLVARVLALAGDARGVLDDRPAVEGTTEREGQGT